MPQNPVKIEVRVRDRVGVVSEVTREISALELPIHSHAARVIHERHGAAVSVFRANLYADDAALTRLRKRCARIKGFLSFDLLPPNGS